MLAPTWDPCVAFRFRNDDGNQSGATWKAAENTGITQLTDEVFRLRVASQMTNSGDTTSVSWTLQARLNGGTWGNAATVNSAHVSNGTNTTKQLAGGSGSFIAGRIIAGGSSASPSLSMTASSHTENEWVLMLSPSLSNGDIVDFRVLVGSTLHTNSQMPSITVSSPAPALAPTLLTPEDEALHHGLDFTWQFNTDNESFGVTGQEAFAFRRAKLGDEGWGQIAETTPTLSETPLRNHWQPEGSLLAVCGTFTNGLVIIDTTDWSLVSGTPTFDVTVSEAMFSRDGTKLAVLFFSSPYLRVYNTSNWSLVSGTPTLPSSSNYLAWNHDDSRLAIQPATFNGNTIVYNTSTWGTAATLAYSGGGQGVSFNHDGSRLAVAHGSSSGLTVYNTSTWAVISGTPVIEWPDQGIMYSPDGSVLVRRTRSFDLPLARGVTPLDTSTWEEIPINEQPGDTATGRSLEFSPDGSLLATNTSSGAISIYDTTGPTWMRLAELPSLPGSPRGMAFSPDGSMLAISYTTVSPNFVVWSVGGAILYEWWNGTGWQGSEVFIESSDEFLELPPGAWDD